MSPERRRRIREILDLTLAASPERWHEIIEQACGGDRSLFDDAVSFLANRHEKLAELEREHDVPSAPLRDDAVGDGSLSNGQRIGPYKIKRLLARGGMGEVYLAVREDDYQQRVALKLISRSLDVSDIVGRFRIERQILAQLDHPNIARLLDGGTTEEGWPYLVMEVVEGEPIDRFCDRRNLDVSRRIELFLQVCSAVQAAHRSLVVHRDLKPDNIVVTADGSPKLLDFGIAKLLQPEAATSQLTAPDVRMLTPRYASPEQYLGDPITTASDVYALGVLLYELLTGHFPYRVQTSGVVELARQICLVEPRRPSIAVGETADTVSVRSAQVARESGPGSRVRSSDPRRLRRRLAGDLDAIVLKAMRKEPEHRYSSVEQLAEDLRRHLEGLPVLARRGGWTYRAGKLARRHKLGLATLLLILGFTIASTVLWRQAVSERMLAEHERGLAVRERAMAVRERTRAEKVSKFLEDLFKASNPDAEHGGLLTVREVLDRGRKAVSEGLEDEPEIQADLTGTLGNVYRNLGLYDEARPLLEQAIRILRSADPGDRPMLAILVNNLGSLHYYLGDYSQAESYLRDALAMKRRLGRKEPEIALTLHNLASALKQQGEVDEAESLFHQVLAIRRRRHGSEHPQVASSLYALGTLAYDRGDLVAAETRLRRAVDIRVKAFGPRSTIVATSLGSLGRVLHVQGELTEAEAVIERALTVRRELLGNEHPHSALSQRDLALVLLSLGDTATAGELLTGALEILRRKKPAGDWTIADTESALGGYFVAVGRFEDAERLLVDSYRILRQAKGERSIYCRNAAGRLVDLYQGLGRADQSERYRRLARAP